MKEKKNELEDRENRNLKQFVVSWKIAGINMGRRTGKHAGALGFLTYNL